MNDFLRGTLGRLVQIVLAIIGILFLFISVMSCSFSSQHGSIVMGWIFFILGILCFCAIYGIRYWLGTIIRRK
jgi:Kef-type K+ transport system membrane component KefB